ncbi:MAG: hypothetical protein AB7G93_07470 [Bdellovibrionales bacterium]
MRMFFLVLSLIFLSSNVNAKTSLLHGLHSDNVVVPLLNGDPSGNELVSGMLYYNTSSNTFIGVDNSGNKVTFGGNTENAVTSGSTERIERARLDGMNGLVTSQSGNWISINRTAAGLYTLTFVTGTFSAAPACVVSLEDTSNGFIRVYGAPTTTSASISVTNTADSANVDRNFAIICMGAR